MRLSKLMALFIFGMGTMIPRVALGQAGKFTVTGTVYNGRGEGRSVLLNNGTVFTVGGEYRGGCVNSAELYSPANGTFSATGSPTTNAFCRDFTTTLLNNGMVLVVGGYTTSTAAELYNPATGQFTATGSLNAPRGLHTATLLPNGDVLIAGGYSCVSLNACSTILSSAELYNPSTGTFSYTGSLNAARENATATLLSNGEVLVAGGGNAAGALASAEIYNPTTGTFSNTAGTLNTGRYDHTATLLGDGQVLVAGGISGNAKAILASAELYNPSTSTFAYTGSLSTGVAVHTATALTDGTVLIAGGTPTIICCGQTSVAEVYSPVTGTFSVTGSLNYARVAHTATLLPNGKVLVAYGEEGNSRSGGPVGPGEIYTPGSVLGYLNPKYVIVGVIYAPPGPSTNTFASYTNSTTIGTTNSLSQSFMSGVTVSSSLSFGISIPLVGSGQITNQTTTGSSQTSKNTSGVTMTFQTSSTEKVFGTPNYMAPVNHDYDSVCVWLNPAIILTISSQSVTWNGYGADKTDQPGMDIKCIPLGYLNGDLGAMPPDIQTAINRNWAAGYIWPAGEGPALTSSDLSQIAAADPFSVSTYGINDIGANPPDPQTSDFRFTLTSCTNSVGVGSSNFAYQQAAPSQTPSIYSCTLNYTNTSTQAQDLTSVSSQAISFDATWKGSGFFSEFASDAKSVNTLTWTTEAQSSISSSSGSTAAFSVQGPPCNNQIPQMGPCVPIYDSAGNQPTTFYVYEDNIFGTFMFAPVGYY